MINTIPVTSPKVMRLKLAIALSIIILIIFAVAFVVIYAIKTDNLNGEKLKIEGTVSEITFDADIPKLHLLEDERVFNVIGVTRYALKAQNFEFQAGQQVRLWIPLGQADDDIMWVMGVDLKEDGYKEIVSFDDMLEKSMKSNQDTLIAFAVLIVVCAVATVCFFIAKSKTPPFVIASTGEKYAEFIMTMFSMLPGVEPKKAVHKATLPFVIFLVMILVMLLFAEINPVLDDVMIATFLLYCVAMLLHVIFSSIHEAKKFRNYYAHNYPIDMQRNSVMRFPKEQREEYLKAIDEDEKRFPNRHYDAGNGFNIEFTPNDVRVLDPDEDETRNEIMRVPYDKLNFTFDLYYNRTGIPVVTIVHSNIERTVEYPANFKSDLHFVLDKQLYDTFKALNVTVNGLDETVANIGDLIKHNSPKAKPRNMNWRQYRQ